MSSIGDLCDKPNNAPNLQLPAIPTGSANTWIQQREIAMVRTVCSVTIFQTDEILWELVKMVISNIKRPASEGVYGCTGSYRNCRRKFASPHRQFETQMSSHHQTECYFTTD